MSDLREAAEMALEFVDWLCGDDHSVKPKNKALDVREALRQALAQPEQEPVAWLWKNIDGHQVLTDDPDYADGTWTPLYTAPPKREWVGLTDDEAWGCWNWEDFNETWKKMEAKLKEKNNG